MNVKRFVAQCADKIFVEADATTFVGGGEEGWRGSAPGELRLLSV